MGGDELVERVGCEERRIAGDDHDDRVVVVVVTVEGGHSDRGGVAGAVLLDLLDEGDVRPVGSLLADSLADLVTAVSHDHDGAARMQLLERVDHVQHHRAAADPVERLGALGPHAGTGTGGEHDRRNGHRGSRGIFSSFIVPGRGLEPL